jgi:hypothetical protein
MLSGFLTDVVFSLKRKRAGFKREVVSGYAIPKIGVAQTTR